MNTLAINSFLLNAAEAVKSGNSYLAHRLVCRADRLASTDRTIPTVRRDAIRAARRAIVATF